MNIFGDHLGAIRAIAILPVLSALIWVYLLGFRGQFWRATPHLEAAAVPVPSPTRSVCVVIPARNEADVLPMTVRSLLTQEYAGAIAIILVDDHSTDGTATVAQETAQAVNAQRSEPRSLEVLMAQPLPAGWTGKLWALEQGTQRALGRSPRPDYLLLSDADIAHDAHNLARLVAKADADQLHLASIMVRLRTDSFWEKLLIPAFVFFFQKLYPFRWVNDPQNPTAGAAGGCLLLRPDALERIGGIATIRHALIDDCALAQAIKHSPSTKNPPPTIPSPHPPTHPTTPPPHHPIHLSLSSQTHSLRPYPDLKTIWDMVARTAYTQLGYSPLLLLGTILAMTLVYLVPPVGAIAGLLLGSKTMAIAGGLGWLLMTVAYLPIVRFYQCSPLFAVGLPAIALLYTLMTVDSAMRHWQGRGGAWKGRTYPG
ncbi:MAG: glycosyltransferase [Synechococcales bacterium]|nr:glycosyltransferase [Synechococcales bacterium]